MKKNKKTQQEPKSISALISNGGIERLSVNLEDDGCDRMATMLYINGRAYHFERIPKEEFLRGYCVDRDPDYNPETDEEGYCYMIAPVSVD